VLAPAIAAKFEALTQKRYESVRLTAQLGTEGIVVGGAVRATQRLSVGTREQLSTLYRLSLAEYLGTTLVLDDQLVQSDDTRMDWFRTILVEKARAFQIIVFHLPSGGLFGGACDGSERQDCSQGFRRWCYPGDRSCPRRQPTVAVPRGSSSCHQSEKIGVNALPGLAQIDRPDADLVPLVRVGVCHRLSVVGYSSMASHFASSGGRLSR